MPTRFEIHRAGLSEDLYDRWIPLLGDSSFVFSVREFAPDVLTPANFERAMSDALIEANAIAASGAGAPAILVPRGNWPMDGGITIPGAQLSRPVPSIIGDGAGTNIFASNAFTGTAFVSFDGDLSPDATYLTFGGLFNLKISGNGSSKIGVRLRTAKLVSLVNVSIEGWTGVNGIALDCKRGLGTIQNCFFSNMYLNGRTGLRDEGQAVGAFYCTRFENCATQDILFTATPLATTFYSTMFQSGTAQVASIIVDPANIGGGDVTFDTIYHEGNAVRMLKTQAPLVTADHFRFDRVYSNSGYTTLLDASGPFVTVTATNVDSPPTSVLLKGRSLGSAHISVVQGQPDKAFNDPDKLPANWDLDPISRSFLRFESNGHTWSGQESNAKNPTAMLQPFAREIWDASVRKNVVLSGANVTSAKGLKAGLTLTQGTNVGMATYVQSEPLLNNQATFQGLVVNPNFTGNGLEISQVSPPILAAGKFPGILVVMRATDTVTYTSGRGPILVSAAGTIFFSAVLDSFGQNDIAFSVMKNGATGLNAFSPPGVALDVHVVALQYEISLGFWELWVDGADPIFVAVNTAAPLSADLTKFGLLGEIGKGCNVQVPYCAILDQPIPPGVMRQTIDALRSRYGVA